MQSRNQLLTLKCGKNINKEYIDFFFIIIIKENIKTNNTITNLHRCGTVHDLVQMTWAEILT